MKSNLNGLAIIVFLISSCTIFKKEDSEKDIRDYLISFQNSLKEKDDAILKQFDTQQSRDVILTAISVLQNKEHDSLECVPAYGLAVVKINSESIQVIIPVAFRSTNTPEIIEKNSELTLWLRQKKNSYVITKVEADAFYQAFAGLKSQLRYHAERRREFESREAVYGFTQSLEPKFDSVIWYARYDDRHFFYVVNGEWDNWFFNYGMSRPTMSAKMGLLDENGELIMPMEFDQVGTIGFDFTNVVEVRNDGKVGLYDLVQRKVVLPVQHDLIIPYEKGNVLAIVKSDSLYGWYDLLYAYTPGFPDAAAEQWIKDFRFIPNNLHIDFDTYTIAEIPHENNAGYGIVVMPSYLTKIGVFPEILGGISPTDFAMNGYTDYVETQASFLQSITGSISALVTTIRERYLDGREEFYAHNNVVFVGAEQDTLGVAHLHSASEVYFNLQGDLMEVKAYPSDEFYEGEGEKNMPYFFYFKVFEGERVERLNSEREYPQTEFVKLDSSYITGDFKFYDESTDEEKQTDILTSETLSEMKNEILAAYGVRLYSGEYLMFPRYDKVPERTMEEVMTMLSEVDSHNVEFLDRMIKGVQDAEGTREQTEI